MSSPRLWMRYWRSFVCQDVLRERVINSTLKLEQIRMNVYHLHKGFSMRERQGHKIIFQKTISINTFDVFISITIIIVTENPIWYSKIKKIFYKRVKIAKLLNRHWFAYEKTKPFYEIIKRTVLFDPHLIFPPDPTAAFIINKLDGTSK